MHCEIGVGEIGVGMKLTYRYVSVHQVLGFFTEAGARISPQVPSDELGLFV